MTRARRAATLLALYAAIGLWLVGRSRPPLAREWGDESSYAAMAESLGRDGDLRFDERDAGRLAARPRAVILHRSGQEMFYSKPVLYPLLAAPVVALLGDGGFFVLNAIVLALGLMMAGRFLARLGEPGLAALVVTTFAASGTLLPYVGWRMTESLEVALVLVGLIALREAPSVRKAALAGFLLGLAAGLRLPNLALAAGGVLALLLCRRWRAAGAAIAGTAVAWSLTLALNHGLIDATNPYRETRTSFDSATGYPAGPAAESAIARFSTAPATNVTSLRPQWPASVVTHSAFYFLVGRHAGVLWYLPFALPLALVSLRWGSRESWGMLTGVASLLLFYIVYMPDNWFGGATAIGNRYALPAYAALLAALPVLPGKASAVWAWSIATLALGSALVSGSRVMGRDDMSQSHAHAGLFRWLPYESTAIDIDGRRDRYWSGEFVRFTDPFAAVSDGHFSLESGDWPAELLSVSPPGTRHELVLAAVCPDPAAVLEVSGPGGRSMHPINGKALLRLPRGPASLRHSFWWQPVLEYEVRRLRLRILAAPGAAPTRARLRWLGDGVAVDQGFAVEARPGQLAAATAGSSLTVAIALRNTGPIAWSSAGPFDVRIGARWFDGEGQLVAEEPHLPLERPVAPGEELERTLSVGVPPTPGNRRLIVDLIAEDIDWFAARRGRALVDRVVEVLPASAQPANPGLP